MPAFPLDTELLWALGLMAGVLSSLAYLPYARDTFHGRTQPQRASWLIWSVLSCIALAGQVYEGATASLWFSAMQTGWTLLIFALALRFGLGGLMGRRDAAVLALAALGLALWAMTETAAYTLAIAISISLLGGSVTIAKAYRDPGSETLSTWVMSCAAGLLAMAAAGTSDWVILAYPAYIAALSGAICAAIVLARARDRKAKATAAQPVPRFETLLVAQKQRPPRAARPGRAVCDTPGTAPVAARPDPHPLVA